VSKVTFIEFSNKEQLIRGEVHGNLRGLDTAR